MARWKHAWETRGGISFANGKQAEIVDGEFDAPDDPALEARFVELGHKRVVTDRMQGVDCPDCEDETPHTHERAPPPPPEDDEQGEGGEPAEAPKPETKPKSKGRKKAEERAPPPPPEA